MDIGELNSLYQEADAALGELFAEQRSNLLLVSGNHYAKRGSRFWNRVRDAEGLSKDQKLRLTKNHIGKVSKIYRNNLQTFCPGTTIGPANPSELSDVKAAEMHSSVWTDIKKRHKFPKKVGEWISDYVDIGEWITYVRFDEQAGRLIGYEPVLDEQGNPVMDEKGEPKGTPKLTGDHVFERVYGFNFLCDPSAQSWEETRWCCIRKMLPTKDLKKKFANDEEKLKLIVESSQDERYKIFDGQSGEYREAKGMTMVREYYFRKCAEYPNGYYYITTSAGILFEGELPLGIFPVVYVGFDEAQTSPRAHSIIKQLRPYQAEINRCASKISEHHITLGDDKLVLIGGSKIAHGGTAHGVKAINVTGAAPVHLPGRSGEQYVGYMQSQIEELYRVANVAEDTEEKINTQLDPYQALYRALKDKKKFSIYAQKFSMGLVELTEIALRYAKAFYTDDMIVPAVGKKEQVNIPEFRKLDDLSIQITIEETGDDIEGKLGKQLVLNHLVQFVGPQLDRSDIGMIAKNMPYGNAEGMFEELTMDFENAKNDILALDRGEQVPVDPDDNHPYIIKKLTNRIKKSDFQMLPPQVQQNYFAKRQAHQQAEAQRQQQAAMANSGFIPTGGYLVACDFYVDVGGGKAPKRARIPYEAVNWLIKKLESQGQTQQSFYTLDPASQAAVGQQMGMAAQQRREGPQQPQQPGPPIQ